MSKPPSPKGERKPTHGVPERVAAAVASPEDAPAGLDWQAFSAAYFPGSRRHNLKAIVAYGAYKRSRGVDEHSTTEAAHLKEAERLSTTATSVEAWENEGGASR